MKFTNVLSPEANAIDLLKQDHRKVDGLFKQFEQATRGDEKIEIAQQICQELTIHALVEEREFYPRLRDAFDTEGDDLIDEAEVEHRTLKQLIAEIDGSTADERLFEANVTVLKEYVQHHVKEEENEIMPKARGTDLDLVAIGQRIQKLKERLTAQAMDAAAGMSTRGKARVRVAKPGTRAAAPRKSRTTARKRTPAKRAAGANGARATKRGNGRSSTASRGNGRGGTRKAPARGGRSAAASRSGSR